MKTKKKDSSIMEMREKKKEKKKAKIQAVLYAT